MANNGILLFPTNRPRMMELVSGTTSMRRLPMLTRDSLRWLHVGLWLFLTIIVLSYSVCFHMRQEQEHPKTTLLWCSTT